MEWTEETSRQGEPVYRATVDGLTVTGSIQRLNEWAEVDYMGRFDWTANRYDGTPTKPTPEAVLVTWNNYRVTARHGDSVWWIPDQDRLDSYTKWGQENNDKTYAKRTVYRDAELTTRLEEVLVEAVVTHSATGVELGRDSMGTDHDSDEELDSDYNRELLEGVAEEALGVAKRNLGTIAAVAQ